MHPHPDTRNGTLNAKQETFIADQLAGLREMGLPAAALTREESLLRAGFRTNNVIFGLFEQVTGGIK